MHETFATPDPGTAPLSLEHPDSDGALPPDDVEKSLEKLQEERCACMAELSALLADSLASAAQIELYIHRIEAINGIMLSLARVTAASQSNESTSLD